MRRGRRDPEGLSVGDTVDCWRVEALEPGRRLRLAVEIELPCRAWLEFEVTPDGSGALSGRRPSSMRSAFPGLLSWYRVYPMHQIAFAGNALARVPARARAPRASRFTMYGASCAQSPRVPWSKPMPAEPRVHLLHEPHHVDRPLAGHVDRHDGQRHRWLQSRLRLLT
jgi:hypothetical protein